LKPAPAMVYGANLENTQHPRKRAEKLDQMVRYLPSKYEVPNSTLILQKKCHLVKKEDLSKWKNIIL
jgi:hypothetical protein